MSDFLGVRRVWLALPDTRPNTGPDTALSTVALPAELDAFELVPVEGADGFFEMPYCSLDSDEWSAFELVMLTLEIEEKAGGWRVVTVH